jgi:hypothetical protein
MLARERKIKCVCRCGLSMYIYMYIHMCKCHGDCLSACLGVVGVPELGGDEEILARHHALVDHLFFRQCVCMRVGGVGGMDGRLLRCVCQHVRTACAHVGMCAR